jgi:hypothetical protein
MQIIERLRKGDLTLDERCDLVEAAKSALYREGGCSTTFLWRGTLLHYGKIREGTWLIAEGDNSDESEWVIVTHDPHTGVDPILGEPEQ